MPANAELIVEGLWRSYEGTGDVLKGVDIRVPGGESVSIVGPSGSGKSTLLNIIGSLETATAGKVRLGDIEVTSLTGNALADYRARRVGFVFQDHHLLPQCTALENVMLPTLTAKDLRDDAEARARELLESVGIGDRAGAFPSELSGGERQRVAVARALVNRPALLLCDEPTGNLDQATGKQVMGLFVRMSEQTGATLLVVTHDEEAAASLRLPFKLLDGTLSETAKESGKTP